MREKWNNKKSFILAAIGAAIGLGNLWRFPFKAYESGGGAFLIPYIVALISCAIPLIVLEFAIGSKIQGGSTKVFKTIGKKFEILGWLQVLIPIIVMMFYSAIIAISLIFMIYCAGQMLGLIDPWMNEIAYVMQKTLPVVPNNQFDFLKGINWKLGMAIVFVWFTNLMIVKTGIVKGIEKINKIFIPILIALMLLFMGNSLLHEGAFDGVKKLFTPDFGALANPGIWVSAYSQVFFSTTIGVGVMIAYGSYLKEDEDIVGSAFITVLANSAFDIIAGITVFATLGFLVVSAEIPFEAFSGSAVAFVAFPVAISNMTTNIFLQGLIGLIFFFSLFVAGISSSISMLESFTTAALDKFSMSRSKMVFIISIIGFGGSLLFGTYVGMNSPEGVSNQAILDIVDEFVSENMIAIIGLLEVIVISWFYGLDELRDYANTHSSIKLNNTWNILLKYFTPILLGIVVVSNLFKTLNEFVHLDQTTRLAQLVFGWGTIIMMLVAAIILTLKSWSQEK